MATTLESVPWARRLKLRHLEVFLALHEAGGLTAAATQLHMTQPALSHWLADLEDVVGQALFVRARRFVLTDAGEVFRGHALRMVGDVERTHADLQAVQSGLSGRINVGTGLPRVLLPLAIERLQREAPGVFVSVIEAPMAELLQKLAHREIDLIIGALNGAAFDSGFATESLLTDEVQVVARPGHPMLAEAEPGWEALREFPWILPPTGAVMRDALDQAFAAQGLRPPVPCIEAGSSIRMQMLVGERPYLSIFAASEVQLYQSSSVIARVPVVPGIPFPDIGAVWEAERSGALVGRFLEVLRRGAAAMVGRGAGSER